MSETSRDDLQVTPLHALHIELGARMVPFAGYDMPVSFPLGVMKEHLHVRSKAGLFDVSHMGQCLLHAPEGVAAALETLVPGNITGLADGRMRYTQLTNEEGGIRDDLMITRIHEKDGEEWFFLVVNGACKSDDFAHIEASLAGRVKMEILAEKALLALQGPAASGVLSALLPGVEDMAFMSIRHFPDTEFGSLWVSRCGYTGEDGFELSVDGAQAEALARHLLAHEAVEMIGLGARDSLRLEAGLCLYGHDIDTTTSPVEAGLLWSIGKARRETGGFPGATRILREIRQGPARKLVGIRPDGRAPAREGTRIENENGEEIGVITSGGFGPSVGGPVAMGYVTAQQATAGSPLKLIIRGKAHGASVVKLPFVAHNYHRAVKA
ncbi:MAG TPA: glycine cleavage system aminomethyltransferase GcvT [Rhizobiales bacterium]|nr:glycine cleavage system aminomethyltransferase GcvT [Hyphomicrobiales bacterium]